MFAVGFLHQVSQLLSVHCSWTSENAKRVAYAGMKDPWEESFKVRFILHIRFVASSKVCSSESTVVGLRRFVTSLSRLQGSHLALIGLRIGELFNESFLEQLIISLCISRLLVKEAANFRTGCRSE